MGYANTISGLQRKRAEIAREIESLQRRIARLHNDREAIERGLRAFGAGDVPLPRHYEAFFRRGELARFIIGHLRQHGPSTTREITTAILEAHGAYPDDQFRSARMQRGVTRALIALAYKGGVVRSGDARAYRWRLTTA